MDAFETLAATLAEMNVTLIDRTRLAFGSPVLKALNEMSTGSKVFVACKNGNNILTLQGKLSPDALKVARFVDATSDEYKSVRPHVNNYAKSRKVKVAINAMKNADGEAIGFTVGKSK